MFRFTDWYEYIKSETPESIIVPIRVYDAKMLELLLSDLSTPLIFDGPMDEVIGILKNELGFSRKLIDRINEAIKKLGGKAFIRWNNAYPKDVCPYLEAPHVEKVPGTMDNVCLFTRAEPFIYATFNSMRIVSFTSEEPGSLTPVIVRKPVNVRNEVRVFIFRFSNQIHRNQSML